MQIEGNYLVIIAYETNDKTVRIKAYYNQLFSIPMSSMIKYNR